MENQFLAEEVLLIYIHIEFEQRSLVKSLEVFFPSKFFFFLPLPYYSILKNAYGILVSYFPGCILSFLFSTCDPARLF